MILSIPKTSIAFVSRIIFLFCFLMQTSAQEISGKQLEKQSITTILRATGIIFINTPNENMPNGTERLSEITIDLINQYFKLTTVKNDRTVEHIVMANPYLASIVERSLPKRK
jgi:hypothetical protein